MYYFIVMLELLFKANSIQEFIIYQKTKPMQPITQSSNQLIIIKGQWY
jgi:hypothetical protein